MSATSAEISVIRRPQVTRCSQDVLIEEEEEEVQDEEDGGGDQSSFQSCTSSPLAQVPQNEEMDSRLTEVGRQDGRNSLGNRVNTGGGMLGTESVLQSRGEKGNNTPSQKCPLVTGLGLNYVLVYFLSRCVGCILQIILGKNNELKS